MGRSVPMRPFRFAPVLVLLPVGVGVVGRWRLLTMKNTVVRLLTLILLLGIPCMAQHPLTLDVSTVVVGSERLETLYAFAMGKWSDAGNHVGLNSTEIHCYLRFGFCNFADASS